MAERGFGHSVEGSTIGSVRVVPVQMKGGRPVELDKKGQGTGAANRA